MSAQLTLPNPSLFRPSSTASQHSASPGPGPTATQTPPSWNTRLQFPGLPGLFWLQLRLRKASGGGGLFRRSAHPKTLGMALLDASRLVPDAVHDMWLDLSVCVALCWLELN